jgi:hypothetical protein
LYPFIYNALLVLGGIQKNQLWYTKKPTYKMYTLFLLK